MSKAEERAEFERSRQVYLETLKHMAAQEPMKYFPPDEELCEVEELLTPPPDGWYRRGNYNAYWTPAREREMMTELEAIEEFVGGRSVIETERFEAMVSCVDYLSMILGEIDSLCDWEDYPDMLCAVDTARGKECEDYGDDE